MREKPILVTSKLSLNEYVCFFLIKSRNSGLLLRDCGGMRSASAPRNPEHHFAKPSSRTLGISDGGAIVWTQDGQSTWGVAAGSSSLNVIVWWKVETVIPAREKHVKEGVAKLFQ